MPLFRMSTRCFNLITKGVSTICWDLKWTRENLRFYLLCKIENWFSLILYNNYSVANNLYLFNLYSEQVLNWWNLKLNRFWLNVDIFLAVGTRTSRKRNQRRAAASRWIATAFVKFTGLRSPTLPSI